MTALDEQTRAMRVFFDALAEEWEGRDFTAEEFSKLARLRARLGNLRGATVYEPGCGAGRLTSHLLDWVGPTGRVVASEISPRMAGATVRRVRPIHGDGAMILCGDVAQLSFRRPDFDLVLLFSVLPHLPNQAELLGHLTRMLKPQGRLVISHFLGSEGINVLHARIGGVVGQDFLPPRAELEGLLTGAGLRITDWVDSAEEFFVCATPEEVHDL